MSIVVMKPGVTSWPCVLETESPSCECVSIANTDRRAVAGALKATVRADAETDGLGAFGEIDPVALDAPTQATVDPRVPPADLLRRARPGPSSSGSGTSKSYSGTVVVHATWLPSAEITGSAM